MNQIPSKLDRNYRCVPLHDKDNTSAATLKPDQNNTSAAALKPDQIQLGFEPTTFGEDATAVLQYWRC